ncbi:AraC family transcriptional regulator [Halovulum sp. GXIMD14793]
MSHSYEDRILRVLEYIHANLDGDLSLDTLADVAAMSRFHWHRVFAAVQGETLASAIRRIRLNRAAAELVNGNLPLTKVAALCGYPNQRSFARVFREAYGLPPEAFRNGGKLLPLRLKPDTGEKQMYPIEIQQVEARKVAALEHKGSFMAINQAFEKVAALAATRNLWPQVAGMVGVFYNSPGTVPDEDLRSHAGLILRDTGMATPEGFDTVDLPAGKVAVMHFKGPYAGLGAAYQHLYGEWLPKSGEEARDVPPYELYLNNPREVAPEDLLTDVCVPLV